MSKGVKGLVFDLRQTNIAKGVALLLLLWHHLFFNSPEKYNIFLSLFRIKGTPVECLIAQSGKVCVAVFLILSGYGLFRSYTKWREKGIGKASVKNDFVFVKNHLFKLMIDYWIVYIAFVPIGFLFNRNPIIIYSGNIVYFLLDFLGVSNIFGTPTMNPTWWFMSLIILIYIIYPLLHRILLYSAEALFLFSLGLCFCYILPDISNIRLYLFPFVLGMYFSKYSVFDRLASVVSSFIKRILVCFLALTVTVWIKYTIFINSAEFDGFYGLAFILFAFLIFSKISFVKRCFEELGKCSGLIFMFHTFILSYYFNGFIYSFKYSLLIFIIFTVMCFIIAKMFLFIKEKFIGVYRRRKNV